jgi:hypothetical protein
MSFPEASPHPMTGIRGIPRTVVALGRVSVHGYLFGDYP